MDDDGTSKQIDSRLQLVDQKMAQLNDSWNEQMQRLPTGGHRRSFQGLNLTTAVRLFYITSVCSSQLLKMFCNRIFDCV